MNRTGHYIITVSSNGTISATCDGNTITVNPDNPIVSNMRLSFFISGENNTIAFRNLKIYPY